MNYTEAQNQLLEKWEREAHICTKCQALYGVCNGKSTVANYTGKPGICAVYDCRKAAAVQARLQIKK